MIYYTNVLLASLDELPPPDILKLFEFLLVGYFVNCPNVSLILFKEWEMLCIIIENVHQFIGHCLIPLDL